MSASHQKHLPIYLLYVPVNSGPVAACLQLFASVQHCRGCGGPGIVRCRREETFSHCDQDDIKSEKILLR